MVALSASFKGDEDLLEMQAHLMINEVVVAASQQVNEFGEASDWVELYNAGGPVELMGGEWYLTDDRKDLHKYELPPMDLEAGAHLLLLCDGQNGELEALHTSFSLSARGEWIALVRSVDGSTVIVDSVSTSRGAAGPGASFGREADESARWMIIEEATPGARNDAVALAFQLGLNAP